MKQSTVTPHPLDARYDTVFRHVAGIIDAARRVRPRSDVPFRGIHARCGSIRPNGGSLSRMQLIVRACQRLQKHRPTGALGVPAPFFVHDRGISPSRSHSSRLYHPPCGRRKRAAPKAFYVAWPIPHTLSAESDHEGKILHTPSAESSLADIASRFPLPWSAYVRLLSVKNPRAREFYEAEALRGGWSVRQLDRQINSQFYERTALSRDKAAMFAGAANAQRDDRVLPEQAKNPHVLEFLCLEDEYSESDLKKRFPTVWRRSSLNRTGILCFLGRKQPGKAEMNGASRIHNQFRAWRGERCATTRHCLISDLLHNKAHDTGSIET